MHDLQVRQYMYISDYFFEIAAFSQKKTFVKYTFNEKNFGSCTLMTHWKEALHDVFTLQGGLTTEAITRDEVH